MFPPTLPGRAHPKVVDKSPVGKFSEESTQQHEARYYFPPPAQNKHRKPGPGRKIPRQLFKTPSSIAAISVSSDASKSVFEKLAPRFRWSGRGEKKGKNVFA